MFVFASSFRTRSDCREANRRTKDVSTKYEHVNKFWVEHSKLLPKAHECVDSVLELNKMPLTVYKFVSQCADLKGVFPLLPFQQGRDIDELFNYAFKDGELGILGVGNSKNTVSV
ncbi:hypothetical protein POM88_026398 [Heracleum sosnowskyi]|uniref:Uncharacterized protein n=1 Tax=Heracleum sosnowskyi TaxID=360622 RepID=A0AAD8MP63_9APIA|nr:hypothetical protein POM88_026398 [Heracleum sosnowskyi]